MLMKHPWDDFYTPPPKSETLNLNITETISKQSSRPNRRPEDSQDLVAEKLQLPSTRTLSCVPTLGAQDFPEGYDHSQPGAHPSSRGILEFRELRPFWFRLV